MQFWFLEFVPRYDRYIKAQARETAAEALAPTQELEQPSRFVSLEDD